MSEDVSIRTVASAIPQGGAEPPVSAPRMRLASIDVLRGLVIVLMALDHARDFFGASGQNPRDITEPALFLTRWITHVCAPTFVLLAGISTFLYGARGRTTGEVSRYLLTRGAWIVFVEFTLVRFGWNLTVISGPFIAQVMWVIGVSMIILAGLVHLPRAVIAAFGLALVAGHNLLDGVSPATFGSAGWIWTILHQPGVLEASPSVRLLVIYPLLPWPGVMALGYALGPVFKADAAARRRFLLWAGAGLVAGFVALRATGLYGDPQAWSVQPAALGTVLSFVNCEKYPPSLLYLMMTLGPALLLLALLEKAKGQFADVFLTYGRVPFLFYVVHLPVIHALAVVLAAITIGQTAWLFADFVPPKPPGYGLGLAGIYTAWIGVLVLLYPLCAWFAGLKSRRHDWWLSYL